MLVISIPQTRIWVPEGDNGYFHDIPKTDLRLEHSLVAMSKWESKYHKPFLGPTEKTSEEISDYINHMCLDDVDPCVVYALTNEQLRDINLYINDPMTATTFNNQQNKSGGQKKITTEQIYFWMVANKIPFECQYWHINRLMVLLQICSIENTPKKKMSKNSILSQNRNLNAARRAAHHTKG